jgi:hypothetical protein
VSSHETALGFSWLYSTLVGDTTLSGYASGGVYRSMAPPQTTTPYVIMSFQAGTDVVTMNGFRLIDDTIFQVRAVGPGSKSQQIAQAAGRLDALLSIPSSGVTAGGAILSCYRESPLTFDELVNGELWNNMGGLYRVIIQRTS